MTQANPRLNMALGQLITNEVLDQRVLDAIVAVPRENFLPEQLRSAAYADEDIKLENGRFLIEPMVLARLLGEAHLAPNSRVLCIGAAPGYIAAVCAQLASRVLGTETNEALADAANANLQSIGIWHARVEVIDDLKKGFADEGPFDAIFLCGAVTGVPEMLPAQIAEGGCMLGVKNVSSNPTVAGLGRAFIARREKNRLIARELFDTATPMIEGFGKPPAFRF